MKHWLLAGWYRPTESNKRQIFNVLPRPVSRITFIGYSQSKCWKAKYFAILLEPASQLKRQSRITKFGWDTHLIHHNTYILSIYFVKNKKSLKEESESVNRRTDNTIARLVIGTSRIVGSAKKFVRITSGFGGGEFTKTLRKVCTCQQLKFSILLLEYCKIREFYAVANAFTIRNMYSLFLYMKCNSRKINRPTKNMTKIVTILHF